MTETKIAILAILARNWLHVAEQADTLSLWQIVRDTPLVAIAILALLALLYCLKRNGRK
jgi:hypothetical protein